MLWIVSSLVLPAQCSSGRCQPGSRDVPAALAGALSDEGREPEQAQPGPTHHHIPSPPSALALPKSTVLLSPNSPNSTQWFQGAELRLCSVWPRKAKSSTESLSSLFTICSGLEPKAAGLVLENPNRFPLHCVYLKRNKDK